MNITTSQHIIDWLRARNISDEIIKKSNLSFDGRHIVIPVLDIEGTHIFNKYRRDPAGPEDVPKYKYETGSTSALYNAHTIKGAQNQTIFITEGELDCLVLNSFGFLADRKSVV